jgi:hypothetical protein
VRLHAIGYDIDVVMMAAGAAAPKIRNTTIQSRRVGSKWLNTVV